MDNENKQIKASKWALGILFVISLAVLVLFFGVGYGSTTYSNGKNLTDPQYTGVLLIWLYALVGICVLSVFGFGIVSGIRSLKGRKFLTEEEKKKTKTGYAVWVFVFTFIVLIVSYFLSSTDPVLKGDGEVVRTVWQLQISDVCLYSIYALLIVSVICSVLSMTGLFKARR